MLIKSVHLMNIRKHINRKFDFAPGVNLLYGANGAGKSSVIEAISLAVFDHLTTKPQASMVTTGSDSAIIKVEFEHNGREWRTERGIGADSYFDVSERCDGRWVQVAHGHGRSVAKLRMALGVPDDVDLSRIARDALVPPQGQLSAGFNLPETGRIDYFTPVLALDKYRRAWRGLHAPCAELGNEIQLCKGMLSGLQRGTQGLTLEQAEEKLDTANSGILQAQEDETSWNEQATTCIEDLARLEEQRKTADIKRVELGDYQERVTNLDARIEGLEAFLPALERLPELQDELAGIEIDPELEERYRLSALGVASLKGVVDLRNARLEQLSQDYQSAEVWIREAEAVRPLLPDAELSLAVMEAKFQRAGEQYTLHASEVERHAEALGMIEPGKPCPVCGELLTEETARERQRELELSKIAAAMARNATNELIGTLPAKIKALRAKIQDYQSRIDRIDLVNADGIRVAIDEVQVEVLGIAKELEAAEVEQSELGDLAESQKLEAGRKKDLENKIQALLMKQVQIKDLDDQRTELASMRAKIEGLEKELVELPTVMDCNLQQRKLNSAKDHLGQVRDHLSTLRLDRANLEQAIEIIKGANELGGKIVKLEEAEGMLARCRQAISDIGPKVADQVMLQLGAMAGRFWKAMGKEGDLGWDGSFLVTIDGLDFRTQLSGGQKVIAALACRLAIAKYRADLGFMILDEPTVHLDQTSKQGLVEVVGDLGLKQIIIVSHDDAFTAATTNVIGV